MEYKPEDFVPYYKELKQHALNLTSYRYELAEDIVQNAYLQFYKDMKNIKVSLKGYLHKNIKWQSLNMFKVGKVVKSGNKSCIQFTDWGLINEYENTELFNAYEAYSFNNTNSFINLKDIYSVINAIKHKKEKKAVLMFMEGYSSIEIGKELDCSSQGAISYAYRGRKKLKQMMMD